MIIAGIATAPALMAVTCTSVAAGGNWNAPATWSGCTGGTGTVANTPGAADTAVVAGPGAVTTNVAVSAGVLTVNSAGILTQSKALTVSNATLSGTVNSAGTFNSTNTLTINGPMNLTGGSFNPTTNSARIFGGLVTIAGGTWAGTTRAATLRGGLTVNSGTFTAGTGIYTFDTNNQAVGGTLDVIIPKIVVTTINLTNNGTLTVDTSLTGTGTVIQGTGATLNIRGTSTVTGLTATASNNLVSYSDTAAQTIRATNFYNLDVSPSANSITQTFAAGTVSVAGNLTVGNGTNTGVIITAVTNATILNVTGNITIAATSTLRANAANPLSIAGNWTNGGTFTQGTSTVVFNGSSSQSITGATTFSGLKINNSAGVTLNSDVTVNAILTLLSGNITTGVNNVIQPAAGSVARTSGHIVGNMRKNVATGSAVARTFEIGTGSNYTPITATFATVSVAGSLTATTVGTAHPQIGTSNLDASANVNRYWTLTNSGITFTTYGATFNYIGSSPIDNDNTANAPGYVVQRFDSAAGTWSNTTLSGTPTSTVTTITGVASLGTGGSSFGIGVRHATKVAFLQQPTNTVAGANITPAMTVQIQDSNGTLVTSSTASVTLAIANNAGSPAGTLSGTASVAAIAGVATFSGMSINKTGTGYTLSAASTGLTSATSSAFNITPGVANKLNFGQQPTNEAATVAISPTITVRVEDVNGNLVPTATNTVVMAISNNAGSPPGTLSGTTSVAAIAGVASFSTLAINNPGTGYTLVATSTGLTSIISVGFDIATNHLTFVQQPTNTVAGASISPSMTIEIRDASNALVTTATSSVTLAIGTNAGSPPGTLSGTVTVSAVSGVATFSGISIDKTGTGYTLTASGSNLTGTTSSTFDITPGTATKLTYLQQPTNALAAASLSPAVTVRIEDVNGNLVTSATNSVAMAIVANPGGSTLSGTTPVSAVGGVATFSNLSLNKTGTGYTLQATSSGLTSITSTTFNIGANTATQLTFLQQPTTAVAGATISPAITVRIEDASGNLVTTANNSVSMAIQTNPGSGSLTGTTPVNAIAGVATFNNLSINKTGVGYTLQATASGLASETSTTFDITPGAANNLAVLQQPTTAVAGTTISPAITVQILDANGNLVTGATNTVAIAIGTNPGSGVLSGTNSVPAIAGVATFSTLSINKTGTGYTLAASSSGLTGTTSATFNITVAAAAQVTILQDPSDAVAGVSISPAITVRVEDAFGNLRSSDTNTIVMAISNNAGTPAGTLSGSASVAAIAGVATFSNLSIDKIGTGYTLSASSSGLAGDLSLAFDITPASPAKVAFVQNPTNALPTVTISPAVTVEIEDAFSNFVSTATNTVTLAIGSNPGGGTLSGTTSAAAVGGTATFSTLSINKSGNGYTLTASASGLTGATSATFNITAAICTSATGSKNWNTAGTWSCGHVPLTTDAVVIPNTSVVTLNTTTVAVDSVTINVGGTLFGDGASKTLVIDGSGSPDLINNGTIDFTGSHSATLQSSTASLDISQAAGNSSVWKFSTIDFNSLGAAFSNITDIEMNGAANPFINTSTAISGAQTCVWTFSGSTAQTIDPTNVTNMSTWSSGTSTFAITNSAGVTLTSGLTLSGNLNVTGSGILNLAGTTTPMPTVGGTRLFTGSTTVNYSGTGAQTVTSEIYGNLNLSGGSTKTLASGSTVIDGNYSLGSSTIFDATTNNPSITLDGNFTNNGTYNNTGTGTFTFAGSTAQTMFGSATTFGKLKIANTASGASQTVTLANDVTVNSTLTFTSGRLVTGAKKVIIPSGGSVSGAAAGTGWVAGNLQKFIAAGASSPSFEIGTDGASAPLLAYTPVATSFTGVGAGGGSAIAFSTLNDHPQISTAGVDSAKSVNRWWTLTTSGVSGTALPAFTNYSATFTFDTADLDAGVTTSNLDATRWTGSAWSGLTQGTRAANSTQATGITALGEFAIGQPLAPSITEISQMISDPINGVTNPKAIPGAIKEFAVQMTNLGLAEDNNTIAITDATSAGTALYVNDIGAVGSGPVAFVQGSPSSGLTYSFTSLASGTDNVDFSNNNGTTWTYTPVPGPDGCDTAVTNIRIRPQGIFASGASVSPQPSFQVKFRVCIK